MKPPVATEFKSPSTQAPPLPSLPLVAIAGTRGKSTVAWLLNEMLEAEDLRVGLWTTAGVFKRGRHLVGELGPWTEVVSALATGDLDIGIQELEDSVVTGVGLPRQTYPLAAISSLCGNNDDCLISDEARRGHQAQHIVAQAVRPDGHLVLNADDQGVLSVGEETDASVTLFALHPDNPTLRRHQESGGSAVWLEDDQLIAGDHSEQHVIAEISRVGFTLNGSLTFQVQNLLCAAALAWRIGVSAESISRGIEAFQPDIERLPGSCNILEYEGATILLDSARQAWALRSLIRGIRDGMFQRTVVVTDGFPDLDDVQTHEAGRLIGRVADVVVTHRRAQGQVDLAVFKDGLANNDVPPLVFSLPSESEGIARALRMLDPGDLCLMLTQNIAEAVTTIRQFTVRAAGFDGKAPLEA
jgi:cyanophycin synthetase